MRRQLRILISSGPTREPLDAVRFISNYSTGYMGSLLASEALRRGHQVRVISGPSTEPLPPVTVIRVEQARQMEQRLRQHSGWADAIIMAAAISDYRLRRPAALKRPRQGGLALQLVATPDIIGRLPRRPGQLIAGFALETGQALKRATKKLRQKRLDVMLAQDAGSSSPFGRRPVRAWLLDREGQATALGRISKPAVARQLLDKIESLWYGQPHRWRPAKGL